MPEYFPQFRAFGSFDEQGDFVPYSPFGTNVPYMPFADYGIVPEFVNPSVDYNTYVRARTNADDAMNFSHNTVGGLNYSDQVGRYMDARVDGNNNISAPQTVFFYGQLDDAQSINLATNINLDVYTTKKKAELIKQINGLNEKIKDLKEAGNLTLAELEKITEQYNEALRSIASLGVRNEQDRKTIEELEKGKESLNAELEARGVRISGLEKENRKLNEQNDLAKRKIAFFSDLSKLPLPRIPGASANEQYTSYLNGSGLAMPAPLTEQERRAHDSQMIMQGHGPFRMYDEGTETFLRDYTDPEKYSDRYNSLAERRQRGHDRMVGLLNAGMITDTDLGWYDAKTQEKLANQYRADNVDPDWLARQQQSAKDTREANRYAMQKQRVQNREDIREARQETRDANRMARRHALGGTLLSDYNSAGWRFEGDKITKMNWLQRQAQNFTAANPVITLMNEVRLARANKIKDYGTQFDSGKGIGSISSAAIGESKARDEYSKRQNVLLKIGEWIDAGFDSEKYNEVKSYINSSDLPESAKEGFLKSCERTKDFYNERKDRYDFNAIYEDYYGYPYNSALSQSGAAGQTGQETGAGAGAGDNEEIKIVSEPLEEGEIIGPLPAGNRVETDAGSEKETAATQTGASSFIPYDNTDVDFEALYDPEGEYMKAIKWIEANPDSELARDLLADINAGNYGPLNGHTIKTDNFRQLATDSKRGPVHNAVMGLIGGDSPYWKNEKYKYESAPWGNVVVNDDPNGDGEETGKTEKEGETEQVTQEDDGKKDETDPLKGNNVVEETQRGLPTWMRYAPIAASALGLFNPQLYRKDYTNANFLRNMANSLPDRKVRFRENLAKMRYTPVDRNMLTNTQNANMAAAMRGASGSNAGNAMAYNLALLRSGNEAIGSQYAQTATANNQMYNQAMQFNSAVNQANAQGNFNAQQTNAQLGQQRDAMRNSLMSQYVQYREASDNGRNRALSTQLNSLSNNLGELGREFYNRNAVAGLPFVYGTDLNGNPYYRGQQSGSGFQVPFVLFPQTQAAQTAQAAAPDDGSVTLTKEQAEKLTPELKAQLGIPKAYGSFLRPYYRRA